MHDIRNIAFAGSAWFSLTAVLATILPASAPPTRGEVPPGCQSQTIESTVILDAQRQDDAVSLSWRSNTGRLYAVEYSSNLVAWSAFPTNLSAAGNSLTAVLDTGYTNLGSDTILLQYPMGQTEPLLQGAEKSVTGGRLIPGSGLNYFNVNYGSYLSSPAMIVNFLTAGTSLAAALTNNNLVKFSFTVEPQVERLDLTSLSFSAARGGSSTPRGYGVLVTTPTTTNELVQPATTVDTVRPNWDPQFVSLAGVSSLQRLTAGQEVTFIIPAYSPAAGSSLEFDDFTLRGTVTPRTLPKTAGAERLFLRVREQPRPAILVEAATKPTGAAWMWYCTRTLDRLPSCLQTVCDGSLSEYGGLLSCRTNATGFFYPLKIGDRWWLVDPQGCLFLHQGVAVISTVDSPGAAAALATEFGSVSNWAASTTALLRQYGLNGAGAWSDNADLNEVPQPLVHTRIANFLATYSATNATAGYPLVFAPTFQPFCQSFAQQFSAFSNDPRLLGYYSDNELSFPVTLLTDWLALSPGNSSGEEAWRWLRERHGPDASAGDVAAQDRLDFLGHVWARYCQTVNQAIKLHDSHHLYLGSRIYSSDRDCPEIFRAIGPHVDVISVNHYNQWTPDIERIRMWERESGRPVMITEFYVKGEDSGMPNTSGAGWVVRTQGDRGRFYQNFVLTLLESKACVGWHWFKYADNDPDAGGDPSNIDANKGVVSNRYAPYLELLEAMQQINERTHHLVRYFDDRPAP